MTSRNAWSKLGLIVPVALAAMVGWASTSTAEEKPAAGANGGKTIVDTAMGTGMHKTLCDLITTAGLAETLKEAGPYTVFAPTDDAFAELDKKTLDDLKKPENKEKLKNILTYHVVKARAMAKDVKAAPTHKTLNGQDIKVMDKDGKVMINDATVTKADVECSNGVIHVIDKVLMPAEKR